MFTPSLYNLLQYLSYNFMTAIQQPIEVVEYTYFGSVPTYPKTIHPTVISAYPKSTNQIVF